MAGGVWHGACMVERGLCEEAGMHGRGAYMAGGMHRRGCAYKGCA